MLKNYLLAALRTLARNKAVTFLNILGLVIGIAASLLILQYVLFERSFDAFHERGDRIYRIRTESYVQNGVDDLPADGATAAGPAIAGLFPEVEDYVRITLAFRGIYSRGGNVFREEDVLAASPSFFRVFSFRLLKGDGGTVLTEPNTMVITASVARKYFGDEDPVGRSLTFAGTREFRVTGVAEDPPENAHFSFDMLASFRTLEDNDQRGNLRSWSVAGVWTYLLLRPGTDAGALQKKFAEYVRPMSEDNFKQWGFRIALFLQPLKSIHLGSHFTRELAANGSAAAVQVMSAIALIILVLGWVNFVNLTTARAFHRAPEIGLRKVVGAGRKHIVLQMLADTLLCNVMAFVTALILVIVVQPAFNSLSGLPAGFTTFRQPLFWLGFLGLFTVGALLSGLYPALVLAALRPVSILKGKMGTSGRRLWLRKALVIVQFAAASVLIVGTVVVRDQVHYMMNKDLGIRVDQTLVLRGNILNAGANVDDFLNNQVRVFKRELLQLEGVQEVASSSVVPGENLRQNSTVRKKSSAAKDALELHTVQADYEFFAFYRNRFLAGRNFSREFGTDVDAAVLNRAAMGTLGFPKPEDAVGQRLFFGRNNREIAVIGVIEDYHQVSLRENIHPTIFVLSEFPTKYSVRVQTAGAAGTISRIKAKWEEIFPGSPFDTYFLEDSFDQLYRRERRFGGNFGIFTLLAAFVAGLGLFGLASFAATQRTKEIGIRKILGASEAGVVRLLVKDFLLLVFVANAAAWPVAWLVMRSWLSDFAFRTGIDLLTFPLTLAATLLVAVLAIAAQSLVAAGRNPVQSLKHE